MAVYDARSTADPIDEVIWCDDESKNILINVDTEWAELDVFGKEMYLHQLPAFIKGLEAAARIAKEQK